MMCIAVDSKLKQAERNAFLDQREEYLQAHLANAFAALAGFCTSR